jgi:acyl carrier protein
VVADAFVTATRTDESASLTGYVVPTGALSIPDLRRDLMAALPSAMIPARFVELAELPRTRTGKVDRAALTMLAGQTVAACGASAQDAPSGEVECWLADQLTDLLDIDRPRATDDVFALGCDSVTAAGLVSRIEREYGVRMPVLEIFVAATVRGIAAVIDEWVLLAADPAELEALLDALEADVGIDIHAGTGNGAGVVRA